MLECSDFCGTQEDNSVKTVQKSYKDHSPCHPPCLAVGLPPDLFWTKLGLLAFLLAHWCSCRLVPQVAVTALPGRVHAKIESYPCLKLFMWLVNWHKIHQRRNRLLQQFALVLWYAAPERLINTSSVFDNLWGFECHVWRRKGRNTLM